MNMLSPAPPEHAQVPLLCPDNIPQPEVVGARVIGVVEEFPRRPRSHLSSNPLAATGRCPGDVRLRFIRLRFSAWPRRARPISAPHFDGANCGLATRIVEMMPDSHFWRAKSARNVAGSGKFPPRRRRCLQISLTVNYNVFETMQTVVNLAPVFSNRQPSLGSLALGRFPAPHSSFRPAVR